jgi:DNA polymerase III gamma/tau subunit
LAQAVDRGVDLVQLARSFLGVLHDLEIVALVPDVADIIDATPEELAEMKRLAESAPRGLVTSLFDRWARATEDAARSQTPRLLLEMAIVDLCFAEPLLPLGDLLERLEKMECNLAASGGGTAPAPPRGGDARPRLAVVPPSPGPAPVGEARARKDAPAEAQLQAASALRAPATGPVAPLAALPPETDIAEVWRHVRESFAYRPALAAALDHAEVATWEGGLVTLIFDEKLALDQTAKSKAEIDRVISQITGSQTRIALKEGSARTAKSLLRSEVGREAESAIVAQHQRENEAREHPMIRRTQELFGVTPRDIKTQ